MRSEHFRYIRYADGSEELYDHRIDPNEWKNLAGDSKFDPLKRDFARWLPKTNVPDIPRKRKKSKRDRNKNRSVQLPKVMP